MNWAGKRIEELCMYYDVYKYNKKLKIKRGIAKCFNALMDSYGQGEVYILYPDTLDSIAFCDLLSEKNQKKISVICEKQHDFLEHYLVRRNIRNPIKIIVDTRRVTSGNSTIRNIALQLLNRCRVVNIYDCLREKGFTFGEEWYRGLGLTCHDIYIDYEEYKKSDGIKKVMSIKRLIGDYLAVRDFINAEKWISCLSDECGLQDAEVAKYWELWEKIQCCLEEIKANINDKEHIVVNWVDALRYDELHNMDFLYQEMQNGIYFEKMYTAAPYTSAVMKTILTGKHLIDDRLYAAEDKRKYTKSRLLSYLNQYNYKFICNSVKFSEWGGVFYNKDMEVYRGLYVKNLYVPSTLLQFEAICRLAEEEKCFMLIHNLGETHAPWLNPINGKSVMDKMAMFNCCDNLEAQELMAQIIMSQKYLDAQLEYYNQFYHNIRYNIYMSDHGQERREDEFALEGLSHIVFSICGKSIQKDRKVEAVSSLVLFPKMIKKCLQDRLDELEALNQEDYVLVQFDDVYSKSLAEFLKGMRENKIILQCLQYRAIVTEEDSYVKFAIGEEYYFRNDKCGNLIKEEQYKKRIAYLKKAVGNQYIDIKAEERYEAARGLYQALGYEVCKDIEFLSSGGPSKKKKQLNGSIKKKVGTKA